MFHPGFSAVRCAAAEGINGREKHRRLTLATATRAPSRRRVWKSSLRDGFPVLPHAFTAALQNDPTDYDGNSRFKVTLALGGHKKKKPGWLGTRAGGKP